METRLRRRRTVAHLGAMVSAILLAAACASDDRGVEVVSANPASTVADTTESDATVPETTESDATVADTIEPDDTTTDSGPLPCPASDGSSPVVQEFPAPPDMCLDLAKAYTLRIDTSQGAITIELFPDRAPMTVNNIVYLARYHYFDDTVCHRVVPAFVIQCGDPTGSGTGGPGYEFPDELPTTGDYQLGSVAMANAGADTNGSQFFIITGQDGVALPPSYSLFGQVVDGFEAVTAIDALGTESQEPSETVTIYSATIAEA